MTDMDREFDVVVVGAGWAGLAVSHGLKAAGLRHVVFEKHRVCETWRTQRWNSFRMNTPNIQTVMPGDSYAGNDPEGFLTRDDFVEMVETYSRRHALPVRTTTPVTEVRSVSTGGFAVVSPGGITRTKHVVIASGNLNVPKCPSSAALLPETVTQMDGSAYREASELRAGAVLVVGV